MRSSTTRAARAALATTSAAALALTLAACGASNETGSGSGGGSTGGSTSGGEMAGGDMASTINGAGASTQQAAFQAWSVNFQQESGTTVNYDPVGSGSGREQFLSGGVDFAGSDAYMDDEELAQADERCTDGAIDLPVYVSPIAIAYNLPGVEDLQLSPDVLAGIMAQQITTWDDPAIADLNPDAELPSQPITPVNRSDDSGTTENFTEYLDAAAPDAWTFGVVETWPVPGGEAAQGTSGVVQAISNGEGSIGYADASQVEASGLSSALVQVGEEYVGPTPEAAAAILDNSTRVEGRPEGDIAIDLDRTTAEAGTYPIVLVSYQIACKGYEDPAVGEAVAAFIEYVASEEGQQAAAEQAGSAPISETLRSDIMSSLELVTGS
ncbi:phosphate ABC transporter substrate-binding protein PstS [Pseudokineococcus marinus]|uniref:Phosphate-binding protein n=1 Tax=Pseudokineococcus marinus TaxID=351215 RepID=A0A849BIA9_9ACTN|nr:phosphate ABC transporter substrate-binding protein PstS [Pseudokineococcus marinus]NNH22919.1 phosphate ABC transporter substrate-binding protein PstS [Pseudokineococcus marinus]